MDFLLQKVLQFYFTLNTRETVALIVYISFTGENEQYLLNLEDFL